jgi:hypothetical protein
MHKHLKNMPKIRAKIIYILAIFISTHASASEERYRTGFVQKISKNNIELELRHTDMYTYIGFLCEPEICKTTHKIKIGDEVLLTLGSISNKNKLLSIRKCLINDADCHRVQKIDIQDESERKRLSKISFEKHKLCRAKMNKDLVNQNSYFPGNETLPNNSDAIRDKYNSMNKQPVNKNCLNSFVKSYEDALLEACLKHKCGEDIGGGCYHIVGYSTTTSLLAAAIEKCSI